MSLITIVFFSIIVVALIVYFRFYKLSRVKDVERLLPDDIDIQNISYTKGDLHLEFQKYSDGWRMISPEIWDVAPDKMRKLLSKLMTTDIVETFSAANPDKNEFGIGRNGEFTIDGSSRVTISVGTVYPKDEELIYIRKTDEKGVSLISASILPVLPKSIEEYRNMLLFEGVVSQIASLEAGNAERAYLLVRTEQGWIMSGKNLFDDKVKPFLDKILTLEAESFMDSSFKLSPKPEVYVIIKISKKTITRNFFTVDDDYYVTPIEGKLLKIKKSNLDFIFSFK